MYVKSWSFNQSYLIICVKSSCDNLIITYFQLRFMCINFIQTSYYSCAPWMIQTTNALWKKKRVFFRTNLQSDLVFKKYSIFFKSAKRFLSFQLYKKCSYSWILMGYDHADVDICMSFIWACTMFVQYTWILGMTSTLYMNTVYFDTFYVYIVEK